MAKFKFLKQQNYLAMIKGSQQSKMFCHLYIEENNKKRDILKNGRLSCAYYVSCILKIFDFISTPHATVSGTLKDMAENNWKETKKLKPGNVLVWEEKISSGGGVHIHIGFYLGNNKAISASDIKCDIIIHHHTYKNTRKIIQILTYPQITS